MQTDKLLPYSFIRFFIYRNFEVIFAAMERAGRKTHFAALWGTDKGVCGRAGAHVTLAVILDSRRSKPSSRSLFMGEQSNAW